VEFCDTDLAGIMHFSNFFRFMEAAETAFLRSLGLSVLLSRCGLEVCLPRVHAECDYRAPLQFEDEVLIHLLVERKGTGSLTYQFRFYRVDDDNREVARGRLVLACAARQENGALKPVPLPKALVDKLQQAPAPALASSRSAAFTPLHLRYAQLMPGTNANHSNGAGARRLRRFASTTHKHDAVKRRKRRAPE